MSMLIPSEKQLRHTGRALRGTYGSVAEQRRWLDVQKRWHSRYGDPADAGFVAFVKDAEHRIANCPWDKPHPAP